MFKSHSNTIQADGSMKTNDQCKLNATVSIINDNISQTKIFFLGITVVMSASTPVEETQEGLYW